MATFTDEGLIYCGMVMARVLVTFYCDYGDCAVTNADTNPRKTDDFYARVVVIFGIGV